MLSRRDILKSSRNRKKTKEKSKHLILPTSILILLLILTGVLAWQSSNQKIRINKVTIDGSSTMDGERIIEFAEEELSGKYFWLFNKDNVFIYPKKKLKNNILEQYKRILDIEIYSDSLTSLTLNIFERKPEYMYCGENISDEIEQCYFLDNTGYIFSKAPYFSGNVFFEFYGHVEGGPIGEHFLEENNFKKTILLKDGIEDIGITVIMFEIGKDNDYVFHIKNGGKIFFNKNQEYGTVLDNLDSALEGILSLDKKIEYIDLRFGNKVFYKFVE